MWKGGVGGHGWWAETCVWVCQAGCLYTPHPGPWLAAARAIDNAAADLLSCCCCCCFPSPPQDVSRVLALLGVSYVLKAVSEDGLFAFNLALPDR